MKTDTSYILGLILLAVLLVVIAPVLAIWSLNTLFPALAIPYTWQTWLAAAILGSMIGGASRKSKE